MAANKGLARNECVKLYEELQSEREVARKLGCSKTNVRKHLRKSGIDPSLNRQTEKATDDEIMNAFKRLGSTSETAEIVGLSQSRTQARIRRLGEATGSVLSVHPHRIEIEVPNGAVFVGSDAHIWPGEPSTALRAFEVLIHELKPHVVCLNGDVFDGARISRFPSIGWEHKPDIVAELAACQEQLRGLRLHQSPARWIWTLGNHDLRFETKIANALPDLAGVEGVHLKDHFPDWEPCWSLWINPGKNPVCIKHRFKGGIHARHTNTLYAGVSIITGHLHNLGVTPWSDYWGVRFGVDSGTLAVPYGPQFVHYTEDNPVNWRSGFAVLTFRDGRLLWPEIVHVIDEAAGLVEFRGKVFQV